jgi:hypothetical protein
MLLLIILMQDGYKSDYNDCHYHGSSVADYCCYLQQIQIEIWLSWRLGSLQIYFLSCRSNYEQSNVLYIQSA